jgi:organic radical activating enzyme
MKKDEPCLLPWIELHVNTLGQLKTCCAQFDYLSLNTGESFKETFNNASFKQIRSDFLKNKTPDVCKACMAADASGQSYKSVKSPQWSKYASELLSIDEEDKKLPIRFLDIRFGKTCNFACRTCDSDNSSRWEVLDPIVGRRTTQYDKINPDLLREQILGCLDDVEEIYFAGGEPLINKNHYLVLAELIRLKKTNIKITYNTNLSVLECFGYSAIHLWEQFKNITLYPSIDSIGEQGEYIRTGFNWELFEKNFQLVKPFIGCLNSVLSIYNIFSIKELLIWAHKNNTKLSIFPAYHPSEISAQTLPLEIRKKAAAELTALISEYVFDNWQIDEINTAVNFLLNDVHQENIEQLSLFRKLNNSLDHFNKTEFLSVFPEHRSWFEKPTV